MKKLLIALSITALFVSPAEAKKHRGYSPVPSVSAIPIPSISPESYLIADSNGEIIKDQGSDIVRPIASISKLMTTLLASAQDLDEELEIPKVRQVHSTIPFKVKKLTRKELMTLALVRSDNFAAQILCTNIENCVEKMNDKAKELGMENTHYNEPTGLDKGNVSTAKDLLKLAIYAMKVQSLQELSSMPKAEVKTERGIIKVRNTNPFIEEVNVILSKTGFTNPAGFCMVMVINSYVGERVLILLGSKPARPHYPEMKKMIGEL